MSKAANDIVKYIVRELTVVGYGYRQVAEGCYWAAISRYGYDKPIESLDVIICKVFEILNKENK